MWPFNRKAIKHNAAKPITVVVRLPQYTSIPDNYRSYADEGWGQNPTVRTCITILATAIARLPKRVYAFDNSGEEVDLPNHPVWERLENPNPDQSFKEYTKQAILYYKLNGNYYHLALGTKTYTAELRLLRPDRVEVTTDALGRVTGFKYTVDGMPTLYPKESIAHGRAMSALLDHYGESPLRAAAAAIDVENKALSWNVSLLDNRAVPSIVVEALPGEDAPDENVIRQIKEKIVAEHGGHENAGGVMGIGGATIKPLGYNPVDMDYARGVIAAQMRISTVLGVPPEIAGVQGEKKFANYQEARRSFYEDSVIPEAEDYLDILTRILQPMGRGQKFYIGLDYNKIQAIQESMDNKWKRAGEAFDRGGMTLDEFIANLGGEAVGGEVGKLRVVKASMVPLDDMMTGNGDGADVVDVMPPKNIPDGQDDDENQAAD